MVTMDFNSKALVTNRMVSWLTMFIV